MRRLGNGNAAFFSIVLESTARGILIPIFSLIFLSRGFSLAQLPAGTAACAAAILVFELPGGIISDSIGRRKVFLYAQCLYFLSLIILLCEKIWYTTLFSMVLYGAARAMSSGSMDALLIDTYMLNEGQESLPKITARLSAARGGGLALGALVGGGIYQLGLAENYGVEAAIVAAILLTVFSGGTAFFFTREACCPSQTTKKDSLFSVLKWEKHLKILFFTIILIGVFTSLIEIYWQPYFSDLLRNDSPMWLLGGLSFGYFGVAIMGSLAAERLLKKYLAATLFPKAYCLSGICLLLLSAIEHPAVFSVIYLLLYFFIGVGDTALLTSLNEKIPPYLRATVLSCQSFTFQVGGMMGAAISGLSVNSLTISGLWFIGGCIFTINMVIVYAFQKWGMR